MIFIKEIIAVINQKGGVGKTSTALAIGAGLALKAYRVLFIDLDAQGNMSYTLRAQSKLNAFDMLTKVCSAQDAVNNNLIASSTALSGADVIIQETGKEYRLKEAIEPLRKIFDYIIIDTPPALGILTVNALTACTSAIIPAQADIFSLQGIGNLAGTIEAIKKYCNTALLINGIVLTRYNARSILTRDVSEMIEQTAIRLETKVFNSKIRECTAIKEAQAVRQNIFEYAPKSNAAIDYLDLVSEIM